MSELFFGTVADERRSRVPAALSVGLHVAVVFLMIVLPPIASLPKVHAPKPRSVVPLVYIPKKAFRVETAEARTPVVVLAKVIASGRAALGEAVQQVGKVEIGGLDRSRGEAGPTPGYSGSGEVVVGGLSGGTAGGKQLQAVGTVGPTDVFTPSAPARNQVVSLAQHAGDEFAQLLSAPTPSYNEEARRLNVTGEVVLEVKLTASGEVHVLRVLSGLAHGLDQAAIEAVNQTRCRPALKAGHPVDVIATIRVVFKLT